MSACQWLLKFPTFVFYICQSYHMGVRILKQLLVYFTGKSINLLKFNLSLRLTSDMVSPLFKCSLFVTQMNAKRDIGRFQILPWGGFTFKFCIHQGRSNMYSGQERIITYDPADLPGFINLAKNYIKRQKGSYTLHLFKQANSTLTWQKQTNMSKVHIYNTLSIQKNHPGTTCLLCPSCIHKKDTNSNVTLCCYKANCGSKENRSWKTCFPHLFQREFV